MLFSKNMRALLISLVCVGAISTTQAKLSKSEQKALEKQVEKRINEFKITSQEKNKRLTVTISGFKDLKKDNIEVALRGNVWYGNIDHDSGFLTLTLHPCGIKLLLQVEASKEGQVFSIKRTTTIDLLGITQAQLDTLRVESLTPTKLVLSFGFASAPGASELLPLS